MYEPNETVFHHISNHLEFYINKNKNYSVKLHGLQWVEALARSYMRGSLPFEGTIEQATGAVSIALKITTSTLEDQRNCKHTRAATLLLIFDSS